jgi:LPS export ABC transporter permease LptF
MKLVQRYVIEEFIGPTVLALLIFTFVMLTRKVDDFVIYFSAPGVSWNMLFKMIGLLLPFLLTMTLPMGLLIACLTVFSRWNNDREILALRISGVSPWRIITPLLTVSVIGSCVVLYLTTEVVPWSYTAFRKTIYQVAATLGESLNEQSFNQFGKQLVIYVQKKGAQSGQYDGVTLFYSKDAHVTQILTAEKGSVQIDVNQGISTLTLNNGAIFKADPKDPEHYYAGTFGRWQSVTDLDKLLGSPEQGPDKPREYTMAGLRNKIQQERKAGHSAADYRLELGRRFAFPFACIVFVLIGVPLGVSWRVKNRTLSFFTGVCTIVVYWVFLTMSEQLGMRGKVPPELAVWLPNIILGTLGMYFTWRTCRQ